jgi:hypothetical protein
MGFLAIYGQLFNLRQIWLVLGPGPTILWHLPAHLNLPAHWLGGTVTIPVPYNLSGLGPIDSMGTLPSMRTILPLRLDRMKLPSEE